MMRTLRVGIIGSGGIAQACHIPGYRELQNVELHAVADISLETAASIAQFCRRA